MTHTKSREIRLKNRPEGLPRETDFELAEVELSEAGEGEILVQNIYMSVDPYMRGRMNDRKSYVAPFQIGEPLDGGCVGRVVGSKNGPFKVGDYVYGMLGWREYFVSDGKELVKVDPAMAPAQSYLGTLGMPGLTAWAGLLYIGKPKKGETVYNATQPIMGPTNLAYIIIKQLVMQGFIVIDHYDKIQQFYSDMGKWIAEGKIKWKETIVDGIENAPRAFIGLFKGENFGKMIVKIGPDPGD